ncbi:hypothetical protein RvY_19350 [Ramazzottius varieornatus]|uniref:Uncharacterized protein n=1 Tax=Ramazzottius varieornatus TaxID=947166 RepID=A0A1D1W943_RAMVA|nr:hypothetical protein RvY_19350 [Ramazzottius varieornatus]
MSQRALLIVNTAARGALSTELIISLGRPTVTKQATNPHIRSVFHTYNINNNLYASSLWPRAGQPFWHTCSPVKAYETAVECKA